MPRKIGRVSGMAAAAASFGSGAAAAAAGSLGSSFNPNRDYELSGDIEFFGERHRPTNGDSRE